VSENKNRMLRRMFGPEKGGENWKMSFVIFFFTKCYFPAETMKGFFVAASKPDLGPIEPTI
jgi:hypothetical protein